jgi:hypothetical protein
MTDPTAAPEPWGWNRHQRIGLGILVFLLLAFLAVQYLRRPFRLDDPAVIVDGRTITLPRRIDPNTATIPDLSRIPHIGETLAGKIIQYRDARKAAAADGIVFHRPADLHAVPGIGTKLIDQLRPFLMFPDDAPDIRPDP